MKALLQQYAAYNIWANRRITATILSLKEEEHLRVLPNSFPTLHATLLHMLDAGSIWWQRLKMMEHIIRPGEQLTGNTSVVIDALLAQDQLWQSWIDQATPAAIEHVFHYLNFRNEKFRQPTYEMLLHVFNHATYHRGQLVTMLRNLQVEEIPATDFIVFTRSKK